MGLSLFAITHWVTLSNFIYLPVESQQFGLAGPDKRLVRRLLPFDFDKAGPRSPCLILCYFFFLLILVPTSPAKPEPNSQTAPGMGTGELLTLSTQSSAVTVGEGQVEL